MFKLWEAWIAILLVIPCQDLLSKNRESSQFQKISYKNQGAEGKLFVNDNSTMMKAYKNALSKGSTFESRALGYIAHQPTGAWVSSDWLPGKDGVRNHVSDFLLRGEHDFVNSLEALVQVLRSY